MATSNTMSVVEIDKGSGKANDVLTISFYFTKLWFRDGQEYIYLDCPLKKPLDAMRLYFLKKEEYSLSDFYANAGSTISS